MFALLGLVFPLPITRGRVSPKTRVQIIWHTPNNSHSTPLHVHVVLSSRSTVSVNTNHIKTLSMGLVLLRMVTKTCRVCGVTKETGALQPRKAACRECNNAKLREYRKTEEGHKHTREIERKREGIRMTCECGGILLRKHIARHREENMYFMIMRT